MACEEVIWLKSRKLRDRIFIITMVAPALILLLAFVVIPLFIGAFTSLFQTTSMTGGGTFIGLKNYVFALQDEVFWKSIKNTLYYAVFITIAKNALTGSSFSKENERPYTVSCCCVHTSYIFLYRYRRVVVVDLQPGFWNIK